MGAVELELSQRRFYFRYFRDDAISRRWGMHVTTCGRSTILPEDGAYPPLRHPLSYNLDWEHGRQLRDYQLIYIPEGVGFLETKKQKIQIQADSAILLRPGGWHRYRPNPETGWHEYWVGFSGSGFKATVNALFSRGPTAFRVRQSSAMLKDFEALIAIAQENGRAVQQMLTAQTGLLLARLYASTLVQPPTGKKSAQMVQNAQELMLSPKTDDMSVKEMARILGMSYANFRRVFSEHTGIGPHQYRLHLRLSKARDLLMTTDLSVKAVAIQCGFEDEQYFCRFFKKNMGQSPGSYRSR